MNHIKSIQKGAFVRDKILLALASYKFLTPSHMQQLGIASDVSYIRKRAKDWIDKPKPYLGVRKFASDPKRGGRENFYFLTKHGKKALINQFRLTEKDILFPKGGIGAVFETQYFHRKYMLYFQILLDLRSHQQNINVPLFYRDFDTEGNNKKDKNLQSKTKISLGGKQFIKPDGVFILESQKLP